MVHGPRLSRRFHNLRVDLLSFAGLLCNQWEKHETWVNCVNAYLMTSSPPLSRRSFPCWTASWSRGPRRWPRRKAASFCPRSRWAKFSKAPCWPWALVLATPWVFRHYLCTGSHLNWSSNQIRRPLAVTFPLAWRRAIASCCPSSVAPRSTWRGTRRSCSSSANPTSWLNLSRARRRTLSHNSMNSMFSISM